MHQGRGLGAQTSGPGEVRRAGRRSLARNEMQAITSPFSESWGEYRLRKEEFSWHKANEGRLQGKWLRGLWSNELYQERRSSTTGRADDMMTVATLSLIHI